MVDSNVLIQNSKLCKSAIFLITYQTSQSYNFQKQKDVTMPLFFKVVLFWTKNCVKCKIYIFCCTVALLCTRKWDVWLKLTDLIWDHLDKTDFLPQPVKLKALRINWSAWAIRTEKPLAYFGGFWIRPFFLNLAAFSASVTNFVFLFGFCCIMNFSFPVCKYTPLF